MSAPADSDPPVPTTPPSWYYYRGARDKPGLPTAPPWRTHDTAPVEYEVPAARENATFQPNANDVEMVNAALHLRRPLLVTGDPGVGKSTLALSVAHDLGLGEVLLWPINSRSTLNDGLYKYDALARLQHTSTPGSPRSSIGKYLRLGPLGTALLPRTRPRVVLVDEIDKSDIDFPNDLLHVFERGAFEIAELKREAREERFVMPADADLEIPIPSGEIRCREFPLVILTSNNERDFSPAFLRRCLRLDMKRPEKPRLRAIVDAHFGEAARLGGEWLTASEALIDRFLDLRKKEVIATDQLLNALQLVRNDATFVRSDILVDAVLRGLAKTS